jgi:hypothetical protein
VKTATAFALGGGLNTLICAPALPAVCSGAAMSSVGPSFLSEQYQTSILYKETKLQVQQNKASS